MGLFERFSLDSLLRSLCFRNSSPVHPVEDDAPRISGRARKHRKARKARNRMAAASRRRNRA